MSDPAGLLLVQFLSWVERRPRTFADVRDAWRSTCPRLTAWEDALDGALVEFANDGVRPLADVRVVLTERGRTLLARAPSRVAGDVLQP